MPGWKRAGDGSQPATGHPPATGKIPFGRCRNLTRERLPRCAAGLLHAANHKPKCSIQNDRKEYWHGQKEGFDMYKPSLVDRYAWVPPGVQSIRGIARGLVSFFWQKFYCVSVSELKSADVASGTLCKSAECC
jgi:hypothetical protein